MKDEKNNLGHSCAQTAIGFNMEVVEYKNIKFNVWDLGGQDSIVCNTHSHATLSDPHCCDISCLSLVV